MTNRFAYPVFDADNHMYEQPDASPVTCRTTTSMWSN